MKFLNFLNGFKTQLSIQTRYIEKEVIEDKPKCEDKRQQMCDDNGENCMEFTRRVKFEYLHFLGKRFPDKIDFMYRQ